ncbi:hypothetical protein [Bacteroides ihuae]|uniref:hypothetical protein n=1 Tax=Bacteroides ihuae TaxID=1852362 RepID=UPI0008D988A4|nr:hypothetical protein [Bacteroides ihuae]
MNVIFKLKRPFIWLQRFRYRCGYGVHSPFAFNFITSVIYEKKPYAAYKDLLLEEKEMSHNMRRDWVHESIKLKRLLFRLVNFSLPNTIIDVGTLSSSALYLRAPKANANYSAFSDLSELSLEKDLPMDFLYLHNYNNPSFVEEAFHICVDRAHPQSVFVVQGIRYSAEMQSIWENIQADERTGISFDLYDLGILFFDKKKIKQHYLINF